MKGGAREWPSAESRPLYSMRVSSPKMVQTTETHGWNARKVGKDGENAGGRGIIKNEGKQQKDSATKLACKHGCPCCAWEKTVSPVSQAPSSLKRASEGI